MKPVTKGWVESARDYIINGVKPCNDNWHLLMVEHLLKAIDELTPKEEKPLTQTELKQIRMLIRGDKII